MQREADSRAVGFCRYSTGVVADCGSRFRGAAKTRTISKAENNQAGEASMARRTKLADYLLHAWRRTVQTDYCAGHINSERSLQALLVANLRALFVEAKFARRIFVEPTVQLPDARLIRPDVVICDTREAICFLELKYVPRGKPATAKDMQSISSIARSAGTTVRLDRYRGPALPRRSASLRSDSFGTHAPPTTAATLTRLPRG